MLAHSKSGLKRGEIIYCVYSSLKLYRPSLQIQTILLSWFLKILSNLFTPNMSTQTIWELLKPCNGAKSLTK